MEDVIWWVMKTKPRPLCLFMAAREMLTWEPAAEKRGGLKVRAPHGL